MIPRIIKLALIAAVNILALYLCLLGFDVWLAFAQKRLVSEHCAAFDIRERRVDAAKRLHTGVSVNGRWYQAAGIAPPKDFAIATYPNAFLIGFKEDDGQDFPIHHTDKFGFFNRNEWWNKPDVLLMGDSFATCETLQPTNTLAEMLHARGINVLNLGLTGTGPVLQMIALRAYWPAIANSIRIIVWLYYEGNDIQDAIEEMAVPMFHDAFDGRMILNPNPENLAVLGKDDWSLYGWRYAIATCVSLKRCRMMLDRLNVSNDGVRIINEAIAIAETYCHNIIIIRIRRPGWDMQSQWNAIRAPRKLELHYSIDLYARRMPLAHYNANGYRALTYLIATNINP